MADAIVRYAMVGLGHIAQVAVLPAFAHARGNSVLTALRDVRVVEALLESARTGRAVQVPVLPADFKPQSLGRL